MSGGIAISSVFNPLLNVSATTSLFSLNLKWIIHVHPLASAALMINRAGRCNAMRRRFDNFNQLCLCIILFSCPDFNKGLFACNNIRHKDNHVIVPAKPFPPYTSRSIWSSILLLVMKKHIPKVVEEGVTSMYW